MSLRSGQTIQLSNTTPTGGTWPHAYTWSIKLAGIIVVTSSAPGSWTVNKVSGNWGQTNAVIDITAPGTLTGTSEFHERYTFHHGAANVEQREAFVVSYDTVTALNPIRYAMAFDGRVAYLAKTEEAGVQIYAGTIDGVPSQARGLIADRYTSIDYLWVDDTKRLWLFTTDIESVGRGILNTDQHIHISSDGGRSWSSIGTVPTVFSWVGRGPSAELLATNNTNSKINISHDEGATWTERDATGSRWWVRNGYQLYAPLQNLSDDMGRNVTDFVLTPSGIARTKPGIGNTFLGIGLASGNLQFRKNNGVTGISSSAAWSSAVNVAAATHSSWTIYQYDDFLIYLFDMNTRYVSKDGGRTWA